MPWYSMSMSTSTSSSTAQSASMQKNPMIVALGKEDGEEKKKGAGYDNKGRKTRGEGMRGGG